MDEIENPDVSAAGRAVADSTDLPVEPLHGSDVHDGAPRPHQGIDTAEQLGLDEDGSLGQEQLNEPLLDAQFDLPEADEPANEPSSPSADSVTDSVADKTHSPPEQAPIPPSSLPSRPPLKRDISAPIQQRQPQRPAPSAQELSQDAPDSLTLADLKRIRAGFPDAQQPVQQTLAGNRVYAFEYTDAQAFPIEIEEWFSYSEKEQAKLKDLDAAYRQAWYKHTEAESDEELPDWSHSQETATAFMQEQLNQLKTDSTEQRVAALQVLCYLTLGVWSETAGIPRDHVFQDLSTQEKDSTYRSVKDYEGSSSQVYWMIHNVSALIRLGSLPVLFGIIKSACDRDLSTCLRATDDTDVPSRTFDDDDVTDEVWCTLTLLYVVFEVARLADDTGEAEEVTKELESWKQKFLVMCTQIISQMRWDEAAPIPQTKVFLLLWKILLLCFGGVKDVDDVKAGFKDVKDEHDSRGHPVITASPLDYHLFRQEISSKYPAYQPPQPLFPFEPENNTILPPLHHRQARLDGMDPMNAGTTTSGTNGHSIMHRPVHIATPAPSPPPSPAGPGGKGGKKQNYQTNQMFPLLYPPLDASSNELGGKGSTELQDALVGKSWQGSDVPASILEAAELFAQRMRATRAMRQLWEARVDYMKYERGWKQGDGDMQNLDFLTLDDEDNDNHDDDVHNDDKGIPDGGSNANSTQSSGPSAGEPNATDPLKAVEDYYRDSLPCIQSVVIVFLKAILKNVTDLVTAGAGRNANGAQGGLQETNGASQVPGFENEPQNGDGLPGSTSEQIDRARSQEIAGEALSAILLLLLKWFKVSHILRYEYLTQLLLDSNYVPLILKLWQTQDIGRACHFKLDREDYNFFTFCRINSRNPPPTRASTGDSSIGDDAAPPPIKYRRSSSSVSPPNPENRVATPPELTTQEPTTYTTHPPEIDELGYAQTPLPPSPLTSYSHRNMFAYINYLRILQKVTRRKTHRSLLLVSYKSSNHLKKCLRIPLPLLRYYTLKLFKSQVPFCGRKWRQSNMKIITAVWLSVPAELRDDWLIGGGGGMGGAGPGDVDGTVEEALPLEQSLRSLTHWWNLKNYPKEMGVERDVLDGERDFFVKELEMMDGAGSYGFGELESEDEQDFLDGAEHELQAPAWAQYASG